MPLIWQESNPGLGHISSRPLPNCENLCCSSITSKYYKRLRVSTLAWLVTISTAFVESFAPWSRVILPIRKQLYRLSQSALEHRRPNSECARFQYTRSTPTPSGNHISSNSRRILVLGSSGFWSRCRETDNWVSQQCTFKPADALSDAPAGKSCYCSDIPCRKR